MGSNPKYAKVIESDISCFFVVLSDFKIRAKAGRAGVIIIGPRQANLCLRAFRHDKF